MQRQTNGLEADQGMLWLSRSRGVATFVMYSICLVVSGSGCQQNVESSPSVDAPRKPLSAVRVEAQSTHPPVPDLLPESEAESVVAPAVVAATPPVLQVQVRGAKSDEGVYFCALFDDEEKLKQRKDPVLSERIPAGDQNATWEIDTLAPGEYAIAVFHDANDNNILDRHALGFPVEAYGFSNNARGKFGPPDYDKVRFRVGDEPLELNIRIQ